MLFRGRMSGANSLPGEKPRPPPGSQVQAARQAMLASIEASPRDEADVAAQRARIAALHQQVHILMQQPGPNSGPDAAVGGKASRATRGEAATPYRAGREVTQPGTEFAEDYHAANREAAKWSTQLRAAPEDKGQGRAEPRPQDGERGEDGVARQLALPGAEASATDTVTVAELRAEQARQRVKFQDLVSRLRSENARLKERVTNLQERHVKVEQKAKEERANRVRFLEVRCFCAQPWRRRASHGLLCGPQDEVKHLRKRIRSMEAGHAREKAEWEAARKATTAGPGRTAGKHSPSAATASVRAPPLGAVACMG